MELFSNRSKIFARIRCLEASMKCIERETILPEALCYVPSFFLYEINPIYDPRSSKVKLQFYKSPSTSSGKNVVVPCADLDRNTLFQVDSEPIINNDGYWLKIVKVTPVAMKKKIRRSLPVYFCLQNSDTSDIPQLRIVDSKWPPSERSVWAGRELLITSWEQVVEIWYGVSLGSASVAKAVVPINEDLVEYVRTKVSDTWTEKYDEQLIKFLLEHPDDEASRKAGTVWASVDSIDLSSTLDTYEESISALVDDNPNSFWETDGSSNTHTMTLHMRKGIIVEKLFINVDVFDESYMPHKIEVWASKKKDGKLTKVSEIEVENSVNGDVCVFEHANEFYSLIEIKILECKDEGIDVRIRGLKVVAKNFSPIDLSIKLFTHEYLSKYSLINAVEPKRLLWRSVVLKRLVTLFDSVLPFLIPKSECNIDEFSRLLQKCRLLYPLSKKRRMLFETLIKETEETEETYKCDSLPKLSVNRRLAVEERENAESSVFRQIYNGLVSACRKEPPLTYRFNSKVEQWWECKFIGEGVIDQGGGFRDSLCDLAEELCPLDGETKIPLPFFVRAANQFEDDCERDAFVVNPSCKDFEAYDWIGRLMGACVRTKEKLILPFSKFTWKRLLANDVSWHEDFITVDHAKVTIVEKMRDMCEEEFHLIFGDDNRFTCVLSDGSEVELMKDGRNKVLTFDHRMEYVTLLKSCRLSEGEKQIAALRNGLLKVVPFVALQLLTWKELETYVCGHPEISVDALKKSARYEELSPTEKRVELLWEALSHFSNEERSKFLRFVTGRRRLPTPLYICPDKDILFRDEFSTTCDTLPASSTCSNTLFLPNYSNATACEEKLRYAINNCVAIDTDMTPWDE